VYTPPGYPAATDSLPVLYLLHGAGGTESAWLDVGRVDAILDNLIAAGRARPMVVVMPFGWPLAGVRFGGTPPTFQEDPLGDVTPRVQQDLLADVIPLVETTYRVSRDPDDRAIAGLSMGGSQALLIGLTNLAMFHSVAGFSANLFRQERAALETRLADVLGDPEVSNRTVRLLWMSCGLQEPLLPRMQDFSRLLSDHGITHTLAPIPGWHQWQVWRRNLAELVPLLSR
jgi:enterochelin esterase family protein